MKDFTPPPQNIEAEEVVLGACLIDNLAVHKVISILTPEVFYKPEHGVIWNAIAEVNREGWPIDLITVVNKLRKSNKLEEAGGAQYVAHLTSNVATAANLEYHSYLVLQDHIGRKQLQIYNNASNEINNKGDILSVWDAAQKQLMELDQLIFKSSSKTIQEIGANTLKQIEIASKTETQLIGLPSGISELDKITSGFEKEDLVIVAARPGMGKTSLVLSIARNLVIDFKKSVAVFSLEMAAEKLFISLLAIQTQIENTLIKKGNLSDSQWKQVHDATTKLTNGNIFIEDSAQLNINNLRSKCLDLLAKHNVDLFIVDYLQLMQATNPKQNNYERVGEISRGLKLLAKELKKPIIALSQLSREVEKRGGNKRPTLSDLRENGSIEQDADKVIFVYRPGYYDITDVDGNSTEGVAELIIAKNRDGAIDTAECEFVDKTVTFRDKRERVRYYDEPDF